MEGSLRRELAAVVHELCQPLTVLQCRLELAMRGGDASLREAVGQGMAELERMNGCVRKMREMLQEE